MNTIENTALIIEFSKDLEDNEGEVSLAMINRETKRYLSDQDPLNVLEAREVFLPIDDRDEARRRLHELVDKFFDLMK